jgi:hypothetical protein
VQSPLGLASALCSETFALYSRCGVVKYYSYNQQQMSDLRVLLSAWTLFGKGAQMKVELVLVALEPLMPREVLSSYLRQHRPQTAVVLISSEALEEEVIHTKPMMLIADEVPETVREMLACWVALHNGQQIDADIGAYENFGTAHDISMQDLMAVVDKAAAQEAV